MISTPLLCRIQERELAISALRAANRLSLELVRPILFAKGRISHSWIPLVTLRTIALEFEARGFPLRRMKRRKAETSIFL